MQPDNGLMTAEILYELEIVTDPQMSPDGKHILFGVQWIDNVTEKKHSNLWVVPAEGGEPRQFTYGKQRDRHARWSPDGREIAFLSNRDEDSQEQFYLIPFDGGERRPLTDLNGAVANFEWSPDGQKLVMQFREKDTEVLEREADEQKKKLGVVARHITNLEYKLDGSGYLPQEKWHIWTVDARNGETEQLTRGNFNETGPHWSPDGSQILFLSNRSEDPAKDVDAVDLFLIPAGGGSEEVIETPYGRKLLTSFSKDGQWIAYTGREYKGRYYQNTCLYIVPSTGGAPRNLTAAHDLHIALATNTDVGSGAAQTAPVWSNDGQFIYVQATARGDQPLLAVPVAEEEKLKRVIEEPGAIGSFSLDDSQSRIAALWGFLSSTGQAALKDLNSGKFSVLTGFNQALLDGMELGEIEETVFDGPGGDKLHGWILKPPGFDPGKRYPSILEIHGGPQTQYGRVFMHEFYYLAAQGYVVHWCNPRGSQGYGEAFSGIIYGDWGNVDYADIMTWTDIMAEQPYIDEDLMGVTGGSFGGYMTSLIIGRTDRYKAAVAQRLVGNMLSFYGSSDMNIYEEELVGIQAPPWEAFEEYWRRSPISSIGNAITPTLIIHSESDLRCDREQGEQIFVALQKLGIDSELVLFPEEPHGLSRGGRTDRRVARLQHIARWFEKYLKQP